MYIPFEYIVFFSITFKISFNNKKVKGCAREARIYSLEISTKNWKLSSHKYHPKYKSDAPCKTITYHPLNMFNGNLKKNNHYTLFKAP